MPSVRSRLSRRTSWAVAYLAVEAGTVDTAEPRSAARPLVALPMHGMLPTHESGFDAEWQPRSLRTGPSTVKDAARRCATA